MIEGPLIIIKELIQQAKFDQAYSVIEEHLGKDGNSRDLELVYQLLQVRVSRIMLQSGNFRKSLDLLQSVEHEINLIVADNMSEVTILTNILFSVESCYIAWWLSSFDNLITRIRNSVSYLTSIEKEIKTLSPPLAKLLKKELITLQRIEGLTNFRIGNYDQAGKLFISVREAYVSDFDDVEYPYDYFNILANLSYFYLKSGSIQKAKPVYENLFQMSQEHNYPMGQAISLHGFGSLAFIGGASTQGLDYFERAIAITEKHHLDFFTAEYSYDLILLNLYLEKYDDIDRYLTKLQALAVDHESLIVKDWAKIAYAMKLKASNRLQTLSEAQKIFEAIITARINNLDTYLLALKQYCYIGLQDYQLSKSAAVLEEILHKLSNLNNISIHQNLIPVQVELHILESKLLFIKGDVSQSHLLLLKAKELCIEHGYNYQLRVVVKLIQDLTIELVNIKEIYTQSSTFLERLETANLIEYINQTQEIWKLFHNDTKRVEP